MDRDQLINLLETTCAQLGEHFDAVQILASMNEEGQSLCIKRGAGNWYARQGMAHEFINEDIARDHAHQIQQVLPPPPPPDEGEEWKHAE